MSVEGIERSVTGRPIMNRSWSRVRLIGSRNHVQRRTALLEALYAMHKLARVNSWIGLSREHEGLRSRCTLLPPHEHQIQQSPHVGYATGSQPALLDGTAFGTSSMLRVLCSSCACIAVHGA